MTEPATLAMNELPDAILATDNHELYQHLHQLRSQIPTESNSVYSLAHARDQKQARRYCVFVAEDNPTNLRFITAVLDKAGYRYQTAEDGETALTILENHQFNLILLDIEMPHYNGIEVARFYRLAAIHKNTPIIALTATATDEMRDHCLRAGFTAVYTKPITPDVLLNAIKAHLFDDATVDPIESSNLLGQEHFDSPSTTLIDYKSLARTARLGYKVLEELSNSFSRDAERIFGALHQAQNPGQCQSLIHELKGMAGAMGADRLRYMAENMHLHRQPIDIDALEQVYEQTRRELNDYLEHVDRV